FSDCTFEGCNLSMAKVSHTAFKNVIFINCKMVGFNFNHCDPFLLTVSFEDCFLHLSSFYKLKLKKTKFIKCDLREVDFADADLTAATFIECNLDRSIFQNTILEKVDFRTATNYSIDPETNRIKNAKFSKDGIAGLLDKYKIDIS
ncbi:MAG: pentapeptide repeat-containing protein, partial [Pedobacter sp.]